MGARIVLFGATGYTGERTAEAMTKRGLRPVLAGRDPARLAPLADRLDGLETAVADVTDARSVGALVGAGDVLVSTVGPFVTLGGPAALAAVEAGAVYLDSTGEPPFIRRVYEQYGPAAERTGAALLTAFASDYVPGVLAGALAVRAAGTSVSRMDVGYFFVGAGSGQPFSRGTFRSIAGLALEPAYTWQDGELRAEAAAVRMRTFDVAGKPRQAVTIGASEQFALPRIAPGLRTVDVYIGWFGPASGVVRAGSRVTSVLGRVPAIVKTVDAAGRLVAARVARAPRPDALAGTRTHVVAEAFDAAGTLLARVRLTGPDAYAITSELLAWAAGRAAEHGVRGTGALDAVSAFGLDELQVGAREAGITQVA